MGGVTRDELLDALTAERYNGGGWVTRNADETPDDEVTTARRRRLLAEDFASVGDPRTEATA